jgi:hypothetical protein
MLTGFRYDGAAVGVTDNDCGVDIVELGAKRLRIGNQAARNLLGRGLSTRRQRDGPASDSGSFLQQVCGWLPPPLPVTH